MALSLSDVFENPPAAIRHLEDTNHLWRAAIMVRAPTLLVLRLVLRPNPPFDLQGFPVECIWLLLGRRGWWLAVPPEPVTARRWKHRNSGVFSMWPQRSQAGTLCLQYPHDPLPLLVTWADGLEAIVQAVHRHLVFEEIWRRTDRWPAEDAPHGQPRGRPYHPITAASTRRLLREMAS